MSGLYQDPHWPRAGAWLRGEIKSGSLGKLAVLGAPVCLGSITPGRCDLAPAAIRAALNRFSTYDLDAQRDVLELSIEDHGDLDVAGLDPQAAFVPISAGVSQTAATALILLGGDNSITRPGVRGLGDCSLLTFDAHLDLRDTARGLTNGNPIRALLEDGFPGERIVQIGIQSFANSAVYAKAARAAGIRVITVDQVRARGIETIVAEELGSFCKSSAVYVDLDMDVLDRAFAPAAPGSRPGGLTPWELRRALRLCGVSPAVRVLDVVEVDPAADLADQTALAAAACLLSFASGVHERCSQ